MERLTRERANRTWRLFKVGWYANIALFLLWLALSALFFYKMWFGLTDHYDTATTMMMAFFILACMMLMGAGISRYQARLESQHLEIRTAIRRITEELDKLRALLERQQIR
ncbi:MAG TPA: hypothetical protein PLO62_06590 [Candidatus Hydrogenedentes bacterium]|nr:hypothetical protein [Candidatus Hydrogenedentota bacterium]HOS03141.1 hypothetical protein [Candidatus Hydrogenedentota bacterium]